APAVQGIAVRGCGTGARPDHPVAQAPVGRGTGQGFRRRRSGRDGDRGGAQAENDGSRLSTRPARPLRNVKRAEALLATKPDGWMETLGARITESEPGRVVVELEAGPQHRHGGGVVQGGVITQIADAAMGMSLATLQEDKVWNTTIELKINFIRPVVSGRIRAIGRVVEMKQTLMFGEADVVDEQGRLVARASSTCLAVAEGQGRE